jgi:hypothetical protein
MRLLVLALAVSLLALAGCSKPTGGSAPGAPSTDAAAARQAVGGQPGKAARVTPAPSLAYAYALTLAAPAQKLPDLLASHEAACVAAGPAVCQVTGASMENEGRKTARGALALRATPEWLAGFRSHLGADAKAFDGRITHSTLTTEDLSAQVIDVQAAIRAKTALRDRLQGLLRDRPGKTADFLEVAKDLSDVQADLDATQSQLAAMQARLEMSIMRIDYVSTSLLGPQQAWAPLGAAVAGSVGMLAGTLGVMVTIGAALAPWAALLASIALAVSLVRSWRARRTRAAAPASTTPAI